MQLRILQPGEAVDLSLSDVELRGPDDMPRVWHEPGSNPLNLQKVAPKIANLSHAYVHDLHDVDCIWSHPVNTPQEVRAGTLWDDVYSDRHGWFTPGDTVRPSGLHGHPLYAQTDETFGTRTFRRCVFGRGFAGTVGKAYAESPGVNGGSKTANYVYEDCVFFGGSFILGNFGANNRDAVNIFVTNCTFIRCSVTFGYNGLAENLTVRGNVFFDTQVQFGRVQKLRIESNQWVVHAPPPFTFMIGGPQSSMKPAMTLYAVIDNAIVRDAPSDTAAAIGTLELYETVRFRDISGAYYLVESEDTGLEGWVRNSHISIGKVSLLNDTIPAATAVYYGPSIQSGVLGMLSAGETVRTGGKSGEWVYVRASDDSIAGWVHESAATFEEQASINPAQISTFVASGNVVYSAALTQPVAPGQFDTKAQLFAPGWTLQTAINRGGLTWLRDIRPLSEFPGFTRRIDILERNAAWMVAYNPSGAETVALDGYYRVRDVRRWHSPYVSDALVMAGEPDAPINWPAEQGAPPIAPNLFPQFGIFRLETPDPGDVIMTIEQRLVAAEAELASIRTAYLTEIAALRSQVTTLTSERDAALAERTLFRGVLGTVNSLVAGYPPVP